MKQSLKSQRTGLHDLSVIKPIFLGSMLHGDFVQVLEPDASVDKTHESTAQESHEKPEPGLLVE